VTAMGSPNIVHVAVCATTSRRGPRRGMASWRCCVPTTTAVAARRPVRRDRRTVTPARRPRDDRSRRPGRPPRPGRIDAGAHGDVLFVDPDPVPTADHVLVRGRDVVRAGSTPTKSQ
jgi:hypothetical protein